MTAEIWRDIPGFEGLASFAGCVQYAVTRAAAPATKPVDQPLDQLTLGELPHNPNIDRSAAPQARLDLDVVMRHCRPPSARGRTPASSYPGGLPTGTGDQPVFAPSDPTQGHRQRSRQRQKQAEAVKQCDRPTEGVVGVTVPG